MRFNLRYPYLVVFLMLLGSCSHMSKKPTDALEQETGPLIKRDVSIVYIPEHKQMPPHIIYKKVDHIKGGDKYRTNPFKFEMNVSPLMRNPSIVARIVKNGSVQREFIAKKNVSTQLSDKKTTWSPLRSKLSLIIPFVAEHENIVITTAYEWMDTRWIEPILFQEFGTTKDSSLTVDIPHGVSMHFKGAKDGHSYEFLPQHHPFETSLWAQDKTRIGQGTRYVWQAPLSMQSLSSAQANFVQLYLSFENTMENRVATPFDSWQSVARYLYEKIDRYDMPSHEIREFAQKETKDLRSTEAKAERILSFLTTDVERRTVSLNFHEQDVQPATRTFARRFGSAFDIIILGKALLSSVGIEADILAASDKYLNPKLVDFYSPGLFSAVLLAITIDGKTHYFDPEASFGIDQLRPNLQGQQALLMRPKNSSFFSLPFASPYKNAKTYSYQLWLSDDGLFEGEYSIDLLGFETSMIKDINTELTSIPTDAVETAFSEQCVLPFSLSSAEISFKQPRELGARVYGQIKPMMLEKNAQGSFDLSLEKILLPILESIKTGPQKGYSSITKISLFMALPERFAIKTTPAHVSVNGDGVNGRFNAIFSEGQLIIEGQALITLPQRFENKLMDKEFDKLQDFSKQTIAIEDTSLVKHVSEERVDEKNS